MLIWYILDKIYGGEKSKKHGRRINCERCHNNRFIKKDKYHYACTECGEKIDMFQMERMAESEVAYYGDAIKFFRGWTILTFCFLPGICLFCLPMLVLFGPLFVVFLVFCIKASNNKKKAELFLESVREDRRAVQDET